MKRIFPLKRRLTIAHFSPPLYYTPKSYIFSTSLMFILLLPLYALSIAYFGYKVAILAGACICLGCIIEVGGNIITQRRSGYYGVTTWLLFPLMTPQVMPIELSLICFVMALLITQTLFGGYGRHLFHPAVVAQLFLMVNFWGVFHGSFAEPFNEFGFGFHVYTTRSITESIPLLLLKNGESFDIVTHFYGPGIGLFSDAFPGVVILCGLIHLLSRQANKTSALAFLGCYAGLSYLGALFFPTHFHHIPHYLLSGSLLFYAFFIFSDPFTSPKSIKGRLFAGGIAAVLTLMIRLYSSNIEGVMYAAVFNYAFSPLYDPFCNALAPLILKFWKKRRAV